ncbi:MAG TPA: methyltransferase domain-containing protein, partial [Chthoniobacterales bacterium]|nr:methyltransferase domain-containing protein [Chthoniobacterales bacterium]
FYDRFSRVFVAASSRLISPQGLVHRRSFPGHSANATAFMDARSFYGHGEFIRPYLTPGMKVLDCGCGPGAISVGLAEAVGPAGHVTGVDSGESQIEVAKGRARANLTFRVASIYELPFEDGTFDLVFSHALFEHLAEPIRGVTEIRRVLRAGGVVGLCSPDWGGFILSPTDGQVETAIARYRMLQEKNGGQTRAGRQLGSWLTAGGLATQHIQARYECYRDSRVIAEYLALQLEGAGDIESGSVLRNWLP